MTRFFAPINVAQAIEWAVGSTGTLHCDFCAKQIRMYRGDTARYVDNGWPQCCGYTMRWLKAEAA